MHRGCEDDNYIVGLCNLICVCNKLFVGEAKTYAATNLGESTERGGMLDSRKEEEEARLVWTMFRYQALPLMYILGDYHLCHHLVLGILVA